MSSRDSPIIGVQAVHPENRKNFKTVATPRADVKTNKSTQKLACTRCFKIDAEELKRCGKCKSVWYCSKECQTAH
ncbi:MYND-type domain-containing protein [Mycena kentingensis (nom. inval.)]|nr:MYND-type domain-containing protein [Mycena kentingensis (nom. inval.)]